MGRGTRRLRTPATLEERMSTPKSTTQPGKNEGEGNRTADRNYREGVKQHLETHDVEAEAEEARDAVEGEEGRSLKKAEEAAKRRAKEFEPS